MGNYVPNLVYNKAYGRIDRAIVRKRRAETYAMRAGRVAAAAISVKATHYAIRIDRKWCIYHVSGPYSQPLLQGLSKAAAEMWLLHKGVRNG